MLSDYSFFGGAFHWQPSEIDNMAWMDRKQIRQAYEDNMKDNQ